MLTGLIISESHGKVNPSQMDKSGQKEDPIVRAPRTIKTQFRTQIALNKKTSREPGTPASPYLKAHPGHHIEFSSEGLA